MGLTSDRNSPGLKKVDPNTGLQEEYLVLSEEERSKGFVRPVQRRYRHLRCDGVTSMSQGLAETYAAQPNFYGATYCATCRDHFPIGSRGEFIWDGTEIKVGT